MISARMVDTPFPERGRVPFDEGPPRLARELGARVAQIVGVRRLEHPLGGGLHGPRIRGAVVVFQEARDRRLARDLADVAAADVVSQGEGDALEARERLVGDARAVRVLMVRLAPPVGILADGYSRARGHRWTEPRPGCSPPRVFHQVLFRPSAALGSGRLGSGMASLLREGAVRTCVLYSVAPVNVSPPTRLPRTVGISFQRK